MLPCIEAFLFLFICIVNTERNTESNTLMQTLKFENSDTENERRHRKRYWCGVLRGLNCFHGQPAVFSFFFLIFRKAKLVGDEKHRKLTKKKGLRSGVFGQFGNLYKYTPAVAPPPPLSFSLSLSLSLFLPLTHSLTHSLTLSLSHTQTLSLSLTFSLSLTLSPLPSLSLYLSLLFLILNSFSGLHSQPLSHTCFQSFAQ